KKAVAIAIRNRWRRSQAPEDIRDEILPNNIIMIGPTGVGKTEIARRLARLAGAPFLKVEASKFTEVGYVGRDVESMVRERADVEAQERRRRTREKLRQQLRDGKLEERDVEIEVQQQGFPMLEMMQPPQGMEGPDFNFTEWLQEVMPKKKKRRTVHLHEARRV